MSAIMRLYKEAAQRSGQPVQRVLSAAISEYRRRLFWEQVNAAYARLAADPVAARKDRAERALWEATLADGLKGD